MTNFKLANGYVLSDEEIEHRAQQWEEESWSGHIDALRVGRPPLSDEPNANLSFKCPISAAELIARAAEAEGVGKSEFMRTAAVEKAESVLALA